MTSELVVADVARGAPMMGALLAIALVGVIVYTMRSRRRSSGGNPSSDWNREA